MPIPPDADENIKRPLAGIERHRQLAQGLDARPRPFARLSRLVGAVAAAAVVDVDQTRRQQDVDRVHLEPWQAELSPKGPQ